MQVDQPYIQRLCKPLKDNGERTTLADLMALIFSETPTGGYLLFIFPILSSFEQLMVVNFRFFCGG